MTLFRTNSKATSSGDDYLSEFLDVVGAPQWPSVLGPSVELDAAEGTYGASLEQLVSRAK